MALTGDADTLRHTHTHTAALLTCYSQLMYRLWEGYIAFDVTRMGRREAATGLRGHPDRRGPLAIGDSELAQRSGALGCPRGAQPAASNC